MPESVPCLLIAAGFCERAAEAIRTAAGTLRDLRVAEVVKQEFTSTRAGR
jgi:hypothetical protein